MANPLLSQVELIHSSKWDVLIILDACRYDYFEKLVWNYLEGKLKKVMSPASHTIPWVKKVFSNRYYDDIVYVSANPFINSKVSVKGFNAQEHFYKVIDVWDWGWDRRLGTVPPWKVNFAAKIAMMKYPSKRKIIHYLQPHAPYLYYPPVGRKPIYTTENNIKTFIGRGLSFIEKICLNKGIHIPATMLKLIYLSRLKLGIELGPERSFFALYGLNTLRRAYKHNLEIVLYYIAKLISHKLFKNKRIIITADHGELLGDEGFSHPPGLMHPKLLEVPWFIVSR